MSTDNTSRSKGKIDSIIPIVTSGSEKIKENSVTNAKDKGNPFPRKITLNIGGCKFTTSRDTLCRVPGSLFESMFSGRHDKPTIQESDEDGSYFLDRDGTHFRHVLNFMST